MRPGQHGGVQELLCYIEDMPAESLDASLPWTWESYGDYLAAVDKLGGLRVDLAGMVGHNMLRMYVMGDEAWERPATEDERRRIAALLDESLAAGAAAMSTSLGFDEDRNKRPVPSRHADDAEFAALLDVLARHGKFIQFIPDPAGKQMRKDLERMAALTGPRGVVSTWINVFYNQDHPDWARRMLDFAGELRAKGMRNYPQVSPRTLDIHVNWDGGMSWFTLANSWHKMVQAPRPEKEPMLARPGVARAGPGGMGLRAADDNPAQVPGPDPAGRSHPAENERWVGATLADLVAAAAASHPSDVLADWLLENQRQPGHRRRRRGTATRPAWPRR